MKETKLQNQGVRLNDQSLSAYIKLYDQIIANIKQLNNNECKNILQHLKR